MSAFLQQRPWMYGFSYILFVRIADFPFVALKPLIRRSKPHIFLMFQFQQTRIAHKLFRSLNIIWFSYLLYGIRYICGRYCHADNVTVGPQKPHHYKITKKINLAYPGSLILFWWWCRFKLKSSSLIRSSNGRKSDSCYSGRFDSTKWRNKS